MLNTAERPLLLFADLDPPVRCTFCGDETEGRYMCRQCRSKPLFEVIWQHRINMWKEQG